MKSKRNKMVNSIDALMWWIKLRNGEKDTYASKFYNKSHRRLTIREIRSIFNNRDPVDNDHIFSIEK